MRHDSPKQALITGGTRGIGEGIARALAEAGYHVTACGLTQSELDQFTPQTGIKTFLLDVTNAASVDACLSRFQSLDVLVNCAGIIQRAGREFEIEGFSQTIEVNLNGTMRMCLAAKPLLAKAHGSIVNTASMLSFFGSAYAPGYAASKGAVAQLTKSLAGAWAQEGIRVNAIAPGWIATDLTKPLQEDTARTASIMARTPLNRWGTPDDLGGVVVFLASDAARFITGTVLPVDGGYLTA